jgi:mRNA-degrading endonuclease RelE of RelBE toxin-antitoxin system
MSYSIIPTEKFIKEAKKLKKKYGSLKNELLDLDAKLSTDPTLGTPLGNNTFKIRIAIKSKGKGKSGGARIITYTITENLEVYLLTIYDKSELSNIGDEVISRIIAGIKQRPNK